MTPKFSLQRKSKKNYHTERQKENVTIVRRTKNILSGIHSIYNHLSIPDSKVIKRKHFLDTELVLTFF